MHRGKWKVTVYEAGYHALGLVSRSLLSPSWTQTGWLWKAEVENEIQWMSGSKWGKRRWRGGRGHSIRSAIVAEERLHWNARPSPGDAGTTARSKCKWWEAWRRDPEFHKPESLQVNLYVPRSTNANYSLKRTSFREGKEGDIWAVLSTPMKKRFFLFWWSESWLTSEPALGQSP